MTFRFACAAALAFLCAGCGQMALDFTQPQAARLSLKENYFIAADWSKESAPIPATIELNSHTRLDLLHVNGYIARITDIPLEPSVTIYARIWTYGNSDFSAACRIPVVVSREDVDAVIAGRTVRMVLVDPKEEFRTGRFVQLRLDQGEDALARAREVGKPLAVIALGNVEPSYWAFF